MLLVIHHLCVIGSRGALWPLCTLTFAVFPSRPQKRDLGISLPSAVVILFDSCNCIQHEQILSLQCFRVGKVTSLSVLQVDSVHIKWAFRPKIAPV